MKVLFKSKVIALTASVLLLGGTAFIASGATGAYFSDSVSGGVSGTVGSIDLAADSPLGINFANLLPGVPSTVQVNFHNSGTSPEDVYLTFPNATALSALNNLGRYGSVTVGANGQGSLGTVFTSYNLNDNGTTCGPFSNSPATGPTSGCWPVPGQIQLASNVQPGSNEDFTFTFEYATALTGNGPATWNTYPASAQSYSQCVAAAGSGCDNDQFTVNPSDGTGSGLPYDLVATQVGITPGQAGSKF
jgi:hypothetical protein